MKANWAMVAAFVGGITLIFGFQNCSSEPPFAEVSVLDRLTTNGIFPYEANIDQVAYMSCSQQGDIFPERQTFFTFRAGAYETGGLRLTDEFLDDSLRLPDDAKQTVLLQHLQSTGARLRLSVISKTDYRQPFVTNSPSVEGEDHSSLFPYLGDPAMSAQIIASPSGQINTYEAAQTEDEFRFEGDLVFDASEADQLSLRSFLQRDGLLSLNYFDETEGLPRGPGYLGADDIDVDSLRRNVFGMGLQMQFTQPYPADFFAPGVAQGPNPSIDMPRRVLSSITETTLGDGGAGSPRSWDCPLALRFRIVLPQHASAGQNGDQAGVSECAMEDDPIGPLNNVLKVVRNSLFAEDWFVDLNRKCVVPKPERMSKGACYGLQGGDDSVIQYDFSQECRYPTSGEDPLTLPGICPHFVSICIRQ